LFFNSEKKVFASFLFLSYNGNGESTSPILIKSSSVILLAHNANRALNKKSYW
jgi:hypothetical protein